MIYAITEYIKEGDYSPSVFRTINLEKLNTVIDNSLIDQLLLLRKLSLDFFKNSPGYYYNQWIDVNDDRSLHITCYEDEESFMAINKNYKENQSFYEYINLKNKILELLTIKFIEHGYIHEHDSNQFDLQSFLIKIDNKEFLEWPKEITYNSNE